MTALATEVVLIVKTAIGPVLERLAAAEAHLAVLGDLRDRLVTVETKQAVPLPVPPEPTPAVDLAPLLERLAAAETRLLVLGDLRDRLVTVETKSAQPVPDAPRVDLGPVLERLAGAEARLGTLEGSPFVGATKEYWGTLEQTVTGMRERLAVVEARPSQPGPPGEPGPPGKDGLDGKDGTAGLTYVGVYQDGKEYLPGDLATWAGSSWHCNEPTTTKPGDGSKAWTLMVKRGRDGKDGKGA
jgi:hypothetical protein